MSRWMQTLSQRLAALEAETAGLAAPGPEKLERWRNDSAALRFHLRGRGKRAALVALLGGTGTGKSTLTNRILGMEVSATSLRRTFTSGPVAVARGAGEVPAEWLDVPHKAAEADGPPARGEANALIVVLCEHAVTQAVTLIDTPDLDGDTPAHHAEADRVFRWSEGLVFLVTPEKYQMTELLPYYRLARRYGVPAVFVMNKCEETAVVEDYRGQLAQREWGDARLFAVPRDDAAFEPPAGMSLADLRAALPGLAGAENDPEGLRNRARDVASRFRDQILGPLVERRRLADRLLSNLRAFGWEGAAGVDVSPVASQLQRRLQEQSVLYLMGPGRLLDRARQVPGLLARLPRTAWDLLKTGQVSQAGASQMKTPANLPDFPGLLADQWTILQSRIDDLVRGEAATARWVEEDAAGFAGVKIPNENAARIAEEELGELRQWLEQRWEKKPRDTAILQKLMKVLPGGGALLKYSEAAPYLLAVVVATHGAVFGPLDLLILGSFSLATWVGERLSNEVTARTRLANRRIAERFSELAREQVEKISAWVEKGAVTRARMEKLERLLREVEGAIQ